MMASTIFTHLRVLLCVLLGIVATAKLLSLLNNPLKYFSSSTDHQFFFIHIYKQISKSLKLLVNTSGEARFVGISSDQFKGQLRLKRTRERVLLVYYSILPGLNSISDVQNLRTLFSSKNSCKLSHRNIIDRWPFWPFQHVQGGVLG